MRGERVVASLPSGTITRSQGSASQRRPRRGGKAIYDRDIRDIDGEKFLLGNVFGCVLLI